jgi:hypothetical protein
MSLWVEALYQTYLHVVRANSVVQTISPHRHRHRHRRPRHQDGGRQVIIDRLVEKSTAGIVYPMLSCTNYIEWSTVMRVNMQAVGL